MGSVRSEGEICWEQPGGPVPSKCKEGLECIVSYDGRHNTWTCTKSKPKLGASGDSPKKKLGHVCWVDPGWPSQVPCEEGLQCMLTHDDGYIKLWTCKSGAH